MNGKGVSVEIARAKVSVKSMTMVSKEVKTVVDKQYLPLLALRSSVEVYEQREASNE